MRRLLGLALGVLAALWLIPAQQPTASPASEALA